MPKFGFDPNFRRKNYKKFMSKSYLIVLWRELMELLLISPLFSFGINVRDAILRDAGKVLLNLN